MSTREHLMEKQMKTVADRFAATIVLLSVVALAG
jgi:hypothetical protein